MARVKLARDWFAPGAVHYRKGVIEDLPEQLLEFLPSTAKVLDEPKPAVKPK